MTFLWRVYARRHEVSTGVFMGTLHAESHTEAVAIAKQRFHAPVIQVVSAASWDAMRERDRTSFLGTSVAPPKPVKVRNVNGTTREATCRICQKLIVYKKDENGEWPKSFPTYHDGRCRETYNARNRVYRAQLRQRRMDDAIARNDTKSGTAERGTAPQSVQHPASEG